jgi:Snf7
VICVMAFLFGGDKQSVRTDPVRDQEGQLRASCRSLDRIDAKSVMEEQKLVKEMRVLAKQGNVKGCETRARDLVRLRATREKLGTTKQHLVGLQRQLTVMQGTQALQKTLCATTQLLKDLNSQTNAKTMGRVLQDFERQNSIFTDQQEIMQDAMQDVFEVDDEGAAADDAVSSVLAEFQLDAALQLSRASVFPQFGGISADTDASLEQRLEKLKAGA